MDKFRVTKDQKIYLGEKEITCCTGFHILAKAGDAPEVEIRVIVESVDIESYRAVPIDRLSSILEKGKDAKHYKGAPEPPYHLLVPPSLNQTRFEGYTNNGEEQEGG